MGCDSKSAKLGTFQDLPSLLDDVVLGLASMLLLSLPRSFDALQQNRSAILSARGSGSGAPAFAWLPEMCQMHKFV
jgi:hypothetical protein